MDFSLNDHQRLIRDTVRQFMETEVRPFVKEWEKQEKFPAETIQKLGEMGCCGMLTPEAWGGPGLDTVSYVLMLEEVARVHTAMSTAIGVTNSAVQAPLLLFGSEVQKKKYLRRMATGETLGAFCLTEPAAGSDAAGIQARAVRDGSVYKLNGTKTWVTNGNAAGVLIVFAKTDPAAGGKGISAFLVEPSFPGFRRGRHEEKMGQHSSPSVEILLNVWCRWRTGWVKKGRGCALRSGRWTEDALASPRKRWGWRKARLKKPSNTRNSVRPLEKTWRNSRRFNGWSRTCRPKLKRRAGSRITRHG